MRLKEKQAGPPEEAAKDQRSGGRGGAPGVGAQKPVEDAPPGGGQRGACRFQLQKKGGETGGRAVGLAREASSGSGDGGGSCEGERGGEDVLQRDVSLRQEFVRFQVSSFH